MNQGNPQALRNKKWSDSPELLAVFCLTYLENFNVAAASAAVSVNRKTGYKYLEDPIVQIELARLSQARLYEAEITVERILRELANAAFFDWSDVVGEDGVLKSNVNDIPEHARRAITEITQKTMCGDIIVETKLKIMSKEKTLELLGKYREIAMFKDVIETNATDEVARVRTSSLEDRVAGLEKDRVASMLKPE